jgi:hypothetical protein
MTPRDETFYPTNQMNSENKPNKLNLHQFLIGKWKRNLTWKEFGGLFQHVCGSNSIVQIEELVRIDEKDSTYFLSTLTNPQSDTSLVFWKKYEGKKYFIRFESFSKKKYGTIISGNGMSI